MSSRSITYSQLYTIKKWVTPWNNSLLDDLIKEKYPTLEAAHKLITQGPRSAEVKALKQELHERGVEAGRKSLEKARKESRV